MSCNRCIRLVNIFILSCLLAGCAFTFNERVSSVREISNFHDGTLIIGEVVRVYLRQEVLTSTSDVNGWYKSLLQAGFRDSDIQDGTEIFARNEQYRFNSATSNIHYRTYLAHVPEDIKVGFGSETGDVVEIRLSSAPNGAIIGVVTRVLDHRDEWKKCSYKHEEPSFVEQMSYFTMGPPQSAYLECQGLQEEGWVKYPTLAHGYEWRKPPGNRPITK